MLGYECVKSVGKCVHSEFKCCVLIGCIATAKCDCVGARVERLVAVDW